MNKGKLYICGTPIGNLGDITIRALDILKTVDLIAAEDTRHSKKLLNHYHISTKLTSYHEHNEREKSGKLLEEIKRGKNVALISDAGMPCISDPGYRLINSLRKEGVKIVPVPGPTAMTSALVISGLPTDSFSFEGFLPRKNSERDKYLDSLKNHTNTMIFYESPHRLTKTLKNILDIFGDRKLVACRELTKKFEETIGDKVSEVLDYFQKNSPRGEFVLVVDGSNQDTDETQPWEKMSILEHLEFLMEEGSNKKTAIKEVAKARSLPKSEVYQIAIKIKVDR